MSSNFTVRSLYIAVTSLIQVKKIIKILHVYNANLIWLFIPIQNLSYMRMTIVTSFIDYNKFITNAPLSYCWFISQKWSSYRENWLKPPTLENNLLLSGLLSPKNSWLNGTQILTPFPLKFYFKFWYKIKNDSDESSILIQFLFLFFLLQGILLFDHLYTDMVLNSKDVTLCMDKKFIGAYTTEWKYNDLNKIVELYHY